MRRVYSAISSTLPRFQQQQQRYQNHSRTLFSIYKFPGTLRFMNFSTSNSMADSSESGDKRDHLTTTANQQREKDMHEVTVTELCDISPTVKKVVLATSIKPVPISFKAGQWLDMFIPNEKQVGGFSLVCSPTYLKHTGKLELAVKYSKWPPAHWIHTKCRLGDRLSIRIGGDFFFDYEECKTLKKDSTLLFIAGGVGINPLASMVFQLHDLKMEQGKGVSNVNCRSVLLFTAKLESELLFCEKFESIAETNETFKVRFFVTNHRNNKPFTKSKFISGGRIKEHHIANALADSKHSETITYICGPPPFIQEMERILRSMNITKIFYETWWS